MQYLTIFNRSSKNLNGTWNGRQYTIAPGKHEYPEAQAIKFKEQNPVMGSEHPYTLDKEYLIAIVDYNEDCSPIEQSGAVERIDRSKVFGSAANVEVIQGDGLYAPQRDKAPLPPIVGAVFEDPNT